MIIILLLSMLITAGTTYSLISGIDKPIRWVLAFSISFVLYSILDFYILMFRLNFAVTIIGFFLLNLVLMYIRYRKGGLTLKLKYNLEKRDLFFLILSLYALIFFIKLTVPWGRWDAWFIWNLHAKFLFFQNYWQSLFTNEIAWSHPDYPLMLPSFVALFWKSIGNITPVVPYLVSVLPFFGILFIVYYSFENQFSSIASVFLICLNFNFFNHASSQYADTLLSFFYLLTIILFYHQENETKSKKGILFLLLGFTAAAGLWVKNEGAVFFGFTTLILIIKYFRESRLLMRYGLGTLLVLVTYGLFKILYAPVNDLIAGQSTHTLNQIFNLHRYEMIAAYLMRTLVTKYPAIPIIILYILWSKPKTLLSSSFLIIGLTFMVYLCVYIVTPYNLMWQLQTSLDRLISQLYPAFIFLFFKELSSYWNFSEIRLATEKGFRV